MTKSRPSHKDPEQLGSHRTERLISLHPWNYVLIYSLFYCYCSETVFSALPLSERDPHPYTAWCCFAFCVLEWYYKGCMNQASISKAQTISYSSNIHKSCEFRLYKMKISCIYYLDVSQGGQRKPRLAIWISPFFFFSRLDLAQNACCVGVLMGQKWMTKALCHPICQLMSHSST